MIKLIKDEIIVVFATSSSESAFSLIIKKLTDSGIHPSVVNVVIPAGYSFNLDGSNIYFSLAIMFLCHTLGIQLTTLEQLSILFTLMLTSKGSAGVVGAAFIVLTDTLASIHTKIPISAVVILLGIDRMMSQIRSATNIVGNAIATIIVAYIEKEIDFNVFNQASQHYE